MPMTKEIAHLRIAREINALEDVLNEAQAHAARLAGTISTARNDCDIDRSLLLAELARLNRVQQHLTSASVNAVRVHGGLVKVGRTVGIADEDCPKTTGVSAPQLANMTA